VPLRRLALHCLLLSFAALAAAQQTPPPTVWLEPSLRAQPIRLSVLDIEVRMQGFIARTTLDLTFDNPNDRVLEGEFVFPLAPGQSIAGYALEVNGTMREGVVVDRQTARVAFEETTRVQIDPGLAELAAGNVFRTRLYPIPARGSKRVRLHIESTLTDLGDAWRYRLPMHFADPVGRLHVRAEAMLGDSAPLADDVTGDPALTFARAGAHWVAELERSDVRPQQELSFRVPKRGGDGDRQVEAADLVDPAWRSVVAIVDSGLPAAMQPSKKPRRIVLFFDASASARDRDGERERAALAAYLAALGRVEVTLVAFRNDADAPRRFAIRGGDASALLDALTALPLDGGSSYGAIGMAGVPDVDQIIVIGDGLSNFGDAEPKLWSNAVPVFVLHAAQRADHVRLARIAAGGEVIDLAEASAAEAAIRLQRRAWRLQRIDVAAGECVDIAPVASARVHANVTVSARCRGDSELKLTFGDGSGDGVSRRVVVGREEPATGALADSVHRRWAQAWIDRLGMANRPDPAKITALAKRYGIVTAGTSLLVLDRIEDYVRYRVEPREPDLRIAYHELLAQQPKDAPDPGRDARLDALAARWSAFRDHHAATYPGIEGVLEQLATTEARHWGPTGVAETQEGVTEAAALKAQAAALTARWPKEGAEPTARAAWEREAARLVFAIEALREKRGKIPMTLEAAAPEEGEEYEMETMRVTGSMITAEDLAAAEADAPEEPSPSPPAPAMAALRDGGGDEVLEVAADARPAAGGEAPALAARIELSGWSPDTPYLRAIRAARDPYAAYLAERGQHGKTPAFYLDVADLLRDEAASPRLALRVLSNLAELETGNVALVRVLAYRLGQWERYDLAVPQFELALAERPEEPQSYRDLALALRRMDSPEISRAVELLWHVATTDWHGRFPDIEIIALHELNEIIASFPDGVLEIAPMGRERVCIVEVDRLHPAKLGIDARFVDPVAVGLRVVLSWDADNTDIDLWVTDPAGERAYYNVPKTRTGGHVSADFTGGYGPEVFTIRRPLPGTYIVHANYFGDRRQSLTGPVTVQLEFQTGFGSGDGRRTAVTRRLEGGSETIEIGRFKVGE
jgi:Ca-activated chloride channel family protein